MLPAVGKEWKLVSLNIDAITRFLSNLPHRIKSRELLPLEQKTTMGTKADQCLLNLFANVVSFVKFSNNIGPCGLLSPCSLLKTSAVSPEADGGV